MPSTSPEKDIASNCLEDEKIEEIRTKNVNEINGAAETNSTNNEEVPNSGSKRKLPAWMLAANNNVSEGVNQGKRIKAADINNSNETSACRNDHQQKNATIKPERVDSEEAGHDDINGTNVKTSPEEAASTSAGLCKNADYKPAVKVEKVDATSTSRESCRFGIRCYRQNPIHRIEEAHPGDSDYKRPHYPPPPDGVPDCPYGNICYRRNPAHFQQYKHPDDTDFEKNYRNHRLRQRKQRQQQGDTNNDEDFSDSDEYDFEDPFINDDSDLDYVPSVEEDYTEELDYDDCDKAEE